VDLLAVNHWGPAVDTHKANHPWARHLQETLDSVDPRKAIPGGRLNVLAASPECTHHSVARGGKPINDQSRATAWHVLRWCEALRIDTVLVENVPEFQTWGPIGVNGRPMKSRRGETFAAWMNGLTSLGYDVQHRVLNAADYGEATTRKRLFVLASRLRGGVKWPTPSHAKEPGGDFWARSKWRAAREIIDWSLVGKSIFSRKRPLSSKTLARIAHGLRKFGGKAAEPFLVLLTHGTRLLSPDAPLPTITTAHNGEIALIQPFIIGAGGPEGMARKPLDINEPLPPVVTENHRALVEPFLVQFKGMGKSQLPASAQDAGKPLGAITAGGGNFGVVEPTLLPQGGGGQARPVSNPAPTVACAGAVQLVEPLLVPYYGATRGCSPISSPMPTATAKQRFALVTVDGRDYALDIRLRMLQPHELAAAMGFPVDYRFIGTKTDAVRMIGNAVAVNQAKALFMALLS
jgi:DNA (cytosine-5)-methyltransferase 1